MVTVTTSDDPGTEQKNCVSSSAFLRSAAFSTYIEFTVKAAPWICGDRDWMLCAIPSKDAANGGIVSALTSSVLPAWIGASRARSARTYSARCALVIWLSVVHDTARACVPKQNKATAANPDWANRR